MVLIIDCTRVGDVTTVVIEDNLRTVDKTRVSEFGQELDELLTKYNVLGV